MTQSSQGDTRNTMISRIHILRRKSNEFVALRQAFILRIVKKMIYMFVKIYSAAVLLFCSAYAPDKSQTFRKAYSMPKPLRRCPKDFGQGAKCRGLKLTYGLFVLFSYEFNSLG